jgi:hypothetical protein
VAKSLFSKTPEDIADLYYARQRAQGQLIARMRELQSVMDGDIVIPLPELSKSERPAVANLALQGMDQLARRIASVLPQLHFPPLSPGDTDSRRRAQARQNIMDGWHSDNHIKRVLGKRARHFLAYAVSPVLIKPDPKERIPVWHVRDPLHTYPAESMQDEFTPANVIFHMVHSYKWLLDHYGDSARAVRKPPGWDWDNDLNNYEHKFDVLEYVDDEQHSMVLMGFDPSDDYPYDVPPGRDSIFLMQIPNLARMCTAVIPGRINVSKQQGHFDSQVGMYQASAALMALTMIQQRKATWPTLYLVGRSGETPEVVNVADPFTGRPGEVSGGELMPIPMDTAQRTLELFDRLVHEQRQASSLPAEFGGMSQSDNVRTGRRGAQVMGASIDFTIAEAQDIFAESLREENRRAIAVDKGWFNIQKSYYIATRGYQGTVNYKPSATWETDKHVVDYPIAGTDLQNLPIEGGQRITMQTLSREGFMEMDPIIPDAQAEKQRIQREMVQTAFLSGIQQLVSIPDSPFQLPDIMRIDKLMAEGKELYEAMETVQREAQERQATMAQPDPATGMPPPEAQPGVATPGMGVEQPAPTGDDQSLGKMAQLLGNLGTTQMAMKSRGNNT